MKRKRKKTRKGKKAFAPATVKKDNSLINYKKENSSSLRRSQLIRRGFTGLCKTTRKTREEK